MGQGRRRAGQLRLPLVHVLAVAHDADDHLYVGDAGVGRIRRIDKTTGIIDTVAGCGLLGYSGDGQLARQAKIGSPTAIRFDGAGNLYFTDSTYHVVRKVDRRGRITTVAGCGKGGFSPDGTHALEARIHTPFGLALARDGTIYFSDSYNHRVRRIARDSLLETVAGCDLPGDLGDRGAATSASINEPHGLCLYGEEILLISDRNNNRIKAVRLDKNP